MKILYDYQAFEQIVGGISNCFVELIAHLPKEIQWEIGIKETNNLHMRENYLIPNIPNCSLTASNFIFQFHYPAKNIIYRFLDENIPFFPSSRRINRKECINLLKSQNFDIFHPTFFDPYFLPFLGKKPFVLTIHDFITDKFNKPSEAQTVWRKFLATKASHIVAVSEKTKEDAIEILGISESRISVIYHGISIPRNLIISKPIIDNKYFLFVGRRSGYKNFIPMVKALAPFLIKNKSYKLVCTADNFTEKEIKLFNDLNIIDSIIHRFVSYKELLNLYRYAKAFIYPSLYEGFGMPILEAYAMGCPVLLNEGSCFPEIAQSAALYFKLTENENTLTSLMNEYFQIEDTRLVNLVNIQYKRLKFFSWEIAAQQLSDIYKLILAT